MGMITHTNAGLRAGVIGMVDDAVLTPLAFTFTAPVNAETGVAEVTATWNASNIILDQLNFTMPAGSWTFNTVDVASPTTYYLYQEMVNGLPVTTQSTTNPCTDLTVDEYILGCLIRFKSVSGVATIYWSKQPNQEGIYELVHNLKEDSLFLQPQWLSGIEISTAAGGKLSSTAGVVRFPGNHPRAADAITNGAIVLEDESAVVAGIDNITTYSNGKAITSGKYHKLLLGILRDKSGSNTSKYIIARQGEPVAEYADAAAALADAESKAAGSFPSSYMGAITPIYFIVTKAGDYTGAGYELVDIRASGLSGTTGAPSIAVSHHVLQDLTNFDDHPQYLETDGTRALTGDWNAGAKSISTTGGLSGSTLTATLASGGAAPMTITSTTKVTNLNADQVDGKDSTAFVLVDGTQAMTGALNMGSKAITSATDVGCATVTATGLAKALTLESTQTTGTAPLAVASTTVVTNLNADTVDAIHGTDLVKKDGTVTMTGALNMGSKSITAADGVGCATVTATGLAKALTLESTQTTGTAPLAVASTTVVTNLNADQLDGKHSTDVLLVSGTQAMTGALNMGSKSITSANDVGCATVTASGLAKALTLESTQTTGTAPLAVASTTVVTNLNADTVDGKNSTDLLLVDGTQAMTGALNMGSKAITSAAGVGTTTLTASGLAKALTFESTQTTGTAPLAVASTTVVTNLNADQVDGKDSTALLLVDGTQAMTGNLNMGSKAITSAAGVGTTTLTASGLAKALTFESTQTTGTAPLAVASTTVVTNLNADLLDGLDSLAFLKADGTVTLTGNMAVGSGITIDGVDIGAHAANTEAHHATVTLGTNAAANLLQLSTQAIELDTQSANTVLSGPTSGAATYPAFRQLVPNDVSNASGALTLANTGNDNVALTAGVRAFSITGPTANFVVTGFVAGSDGTVIYLYNGSGKTMTLTNDSASSTAGNRIYNAGGTVVTGSTVMLIYMTTGGLNHWCRIG